MAEGWGAMLHRNMHFYRSVGVFQGEARSTCRRALPARLRRRTQSGAASVEFALVMLPFLLIIFGLIQYGLYFYSVQTGGHMTATAGRQISVGNCSNINTLTTYINDGIGAARDRSASAPWSVTRTYYHNNAVVSQAAAQQGDKVNLTVEYASINMHFPLLPFISDAKITRTVEVRLEDTTDGGCPS